MINPEELRILRLALIKYILALKIESLGGSNNERAQKIARDLLRTKIK